MKSNVEINLLKKIKRKEERKRRKWIHQVLQKAVKKKLSKNTVTAVSNVE